MQAFANIASNKVIKDKPLAPITLFFVSVFQTGPRPLIKKEKAFFSLLNYSIKRKHKENT